MKFQGIHHLLPRRFQPLLRQLSFKSRWWLILAMKLPQFPGDGIKWLPGRLQGWVSKGKSFRSRNQALLPPPGCKGAATTVVLPWKVGKMFWAGKARGGQALSSPSPEASFLCCPCLSFLQGISLKSPSSFLTAGLRICKHHFQESRAALEPSTSIQAALRRAQPQPYDCTGATNTSLLFQ